jgi:tripartite-type tricarboxylate transporter receptor subunit TctC
MRAILVRIAAVSFALVAATHLQLASAQTYPSRPVRVIVPIVAGAVLDALARTLGQQMSESIGQPVLVENRPGGSSIIGMQTCAKAPPDGYTLCITVADSLSYVPHLFKNLPFDPENDFAPIIYLVRGTSMLLANANAPFSSYKEMIAYAKAKPGAVNWGTWGAGSIPDMYLQWSKHQMGVDITAVPYKGGGQAIPALLAGEVHVTFMAVGPMLPHIRAGKLKPIAIVGDRRTSLLPDVPSLADERADPGVRSYFGAFAPGKTPAAIVERLNAEFAKALQAPRLQEFVRTQTLDVVGGSAAEFAEFLRADRASAGRLFRAIGVKPTDAPSS